MLRVVVCFACARIAIRQEWGAVRWITLDSVILGWVAVRVLAFSLLWQNTASLVNGLGYAVDYIGLYFIFRVLVPDIHKFEKVISMFAVSLLPVAILMCLEKATGRNPFGFLGGVPEFTEVREGVLRCQGPFGHPILAGTFGAAWFPLFVGLWVQGRSSRLIAAVGVVSSALITITSGSSGPIGSFLAGIIGLSMWRIRSHMGAVRWGLVACILVLQVAMKDPVWFIFAKVNVFSGSTGWHRANLIDQAIKHFGDWWLVGAKDISQWGVWAGDTTNQFIAEGVRGGILTMALFTCIVVTTFSYMGKTMLLTKREPRKYQLFLWSIGVGVFSNVMSFLSVAYFDQNIVTWFLIVAVVGNLFEQQRRRHDCYIFARRKAAIVDTSDVTVSESLFSLLITQGDPVTCFPNPTACDSSSIL